jgi:uncharacterized protein (TIGR03089 family)
VTPPPPPVAPRRPATVAQALSGLLTAPGTPRLTWYGPAGERVELSGAVLDNWVSKTTNLLVEELDAGPGTRVLLDLPPHWRTVLWALAAWRVGASVVLDPADPGVDVAVSDRPAALALPRGAGVVAVALPALARRFDGDLPAGALDAAQSVMTYGDVIGWAPETDPTLTALAADPPVTHAALLDVATAAAPVPAGSRTLLPVGDDRSATAGTVMAVLGVLAGGGSVVALHPDDTDGAAADPAAAASARAARAERIAATERVTARL